MVTLWILDLELCGFCAGCERGLVCFDETGILVVVVYAL